MTYLQVHKKYDDEPVSSNDEEEHDVIVDIPDNWQQDELEEHNAIVNENNATVRKETITSVLNITNRMNTTRQRPPQRPPQRYPRMNAGQNEHVRKIRKTFSRYTGMHGFFSKYF